MKKILFSILIGLMIGGLAIAGIFYFKQKNTTEDSTKTSETPSVKTSEETSELAETGEINGFGYEDVWVTNPTSGAKLLVTIQFPDMQEPSPLLLVIPGGLDSGKSMSEEPMIKKLLENGYIVAHFAADGRDPSEGTEDYNGYISQDGAHAVLEYLVTREEVDIEKIGVISMSYGIAMASGMLARYDEPKVKFYIDWEGPPTKEYVGCDPATSNSSYDWPPCDDMDFWSEREAYVFLEQLDIPYLRVQGMDDHAQGVDTYHATIAINAATNGDSPWTRVNNNPENTTYTEENPPELLEGKNIIMTIPDFVKELSLKFF